MKMAWLAIAAGLVVAVSCGLLFAQDDAQNPADGADAPKGAEFIDGHVKEIDLKLAKVALEISADPDNLGEIKIFTLSAETLVRKNGKALKITDVHKGKFVRVYYTPTDKKGESGKALLIEIYDTRGIGRGGRGRGR